MNNKKKIAEELKELSPFLSKMKKEQPFSVPSDYFEQMQQEVLQKTQRLHEESVPPRASWLDWLAAQAALLLQPRIAVALTTVVLLIAVAIWWYPSAQVQQVDYLAEVSYEEMQQYLSDHIEEMDDELLLKISDELSGVNFLSPADFEAEEVEILLDEIIEDLDDESLEELL